MGTIPAGQDAVANAERPALEKKAFDKIAWRVVPILVLAYIVNFLDRTNVGFAALTMNKDIGLTEAEFGYGAGILFLGYSLFEVPSNVALYKVGARLWLARIMITWGALSMAAVFVTGAQSFYVLRFLLGIAEAGFFPGAAFYLAQCFPPHYRAKIFAWFLVGIPASVVIGGPVSSLLLEMDGTLGLAGWKWLFIVEGAPAILVGILVLLFLPNKPAEAGWLSPEEKEAVQARLAAETKEREQHRFWASLADARVLLLAATQFTYTVGSYGIALFLPLIIKGYNFSDLTVTRLSGTAGSYGIEQFLPFIIKGHNFSDLAVGFLTAIPNLIACVVMIYWAIAVGRSGRKIAGLAMTCIVSGIGLLIAIWANSFVIAFLGLTVAVVGTNTARAIIWTIPASFLSGIGAAGGLALMNSIGTSGGVAGPSIMGFFKHMTGSFDIGLMVLSGFLFAAAAMTFSLKLLIKRE